MIKKIISKPFNLIFIIFLLLSYATLYVSGQDIKYRKNVLLNSIFSINFDSNTFIIQYLDKEFLSLVSKDIAYDTVTFHFKPKKVGETRLEFYDSIKKGVVTYLISISNNPDVNPGFLNSYIGNNSISNNPQNTNAISNFDIAFFLFSNGMYQDAINYFIRGRENEPEIYKRLGPSKISYYLGVCYFNLKQYNIASSYFAISKSSTDYEIQTFSYYYMAKTQILLGNYDLAIDNLFYLIYRLKETDALFDNAYFLISSIYFERKDYEHIILLVYPKINILDNSSYKDYFNYYLAISYYDGRKDFYIAYTFLKKITNNSFEYYQKVVELMKNIETNFLDFH